MLAMKQTLIIMVSGPQPGLEDQRLLKLASFMGVSARAISIQGDKEPLQCCADEFKAGTYGLALSADTLNAIDKSSNPISGSIAEFSGELLVFGCNASAEQTRAISRLTAGAVSGVRSRSEPAERFSLPHGVRSLSRQLAGQSFMGGSGASMPAFELRDAAEEVDVILEANERPIFVRIRNGVAEVFLLSAPLADIDRPLSRDHGLEDHYHSLISPLIFLRHCFGDSCWHGTGSTARLIIDDPLLSDRYGFLDLDDLKKSMLRSRYGTTIAFIPWYHWRTSRRKATQLLGENATLSICIHGCDHTNREFDQVSEVLLERKSGLAMRRMEAQRQRAGANFEPVMVFPQGLFSSAALPALRANHFLATVNSTCFPTDSRADDLKIQDFLRPAITRYNGFPVFHRHYPRRLFDFAFSLFLGKPAFVVEHHQYFREGFGPLEELVAGMYKIEPKLSWPTLTDQVTRSCLERTLPNGSVEVRFFTRRFQLSNAAPGSGRFLLRKEEPDESMIACVRVDGVSVPFSFDRGSLQLEVEADSRQTRSIEIVDRTQPHAQAAGFGLAHNARVLLRRGLSEFRDNTLARHDGLLKAANGVARILKVTGDT